MPKYKVIRRPRPTFGNPRLIQDSIYYPRAYQFDIPYSQLTLDEIAARNRYDISNPKIIYDASKSGNLVGGIIPSFVGNSVKIVGRTLAGTVNDMIQSSKSSNRTNKKPYGGGLQKGYTPEELLMLQQTINRNPVTLDEEGNLIIDDRLIESGATPEQIASLVQQDQFGTQQPLEEQAIQNEAVAQQQAAIQENIMAEDAIANTPAVNNQKYTIQPGDTLSAIAQAFGTDYKTIAEANGISDPNKIIAGRTINIPTTKVNTPGHIKRVYNQKAKAAAQSNTPTNNTSTSSTNNTNTTTNTTNTNTQNTSTPPPASEITTNTPTNTSTTQTTPAVNYDDDMFSLIKPHKGENNSDEFDLLGIRKNFNDLLNTTSNNTETKETSSKSNNKSNNWLLEKAYELAAKRGYSKEDVDKGIENYIKLQKNVKAQKEKEQTARARAIERHNNEVRAREKEQNSNFWSMLGHSLNRAEQGAGQSAANAWEDFNAMAQRSNVPEDERQAAQQIADEIRTGEKGFTTAAMTGISAGTAGWIPTLLGTAGSYIGSEAGQKISDNYAQSKGYPNYMMMLQDKYNEGKPKREQINLEDTPNPWAIGGGFVGGFFGGKGGYHATKGKVNTGATRSKTTYKTITEESKPTDPRTMSTVETTKPSMEVEYTPVKKSRSEIRAQKKRISENTKARKNKVKQENVTPENNTNNTNNNTSKSITSKNTNNSLKYENQSADAVANEKKLKMFNKLKSKLEQAKTPEERQQLFKQYEKQIQKYHGVAKPEEIEHYQQVLDRYKRIYGNKTTAKQTVTSNVKPKSSKQTSKPNSTNTKTNTETKTTNKQNTSTNTEPKSTTSTTPKTSTTTKTNKQIAKERLKNIKQIRKDRETGRNITEEYNPKAVNEGKEVNISEEELTNEALAAGPVKDVNSKNKTSLMTRIRNKATGVKNSKTETPKPETKKQTRAEKKAEKKIQKEAEKQLKEEQTKAAVDAKKEELKSQQQTQQPKPEPKPEPKQTSSNTQQQTQQNNKPKTAKDIVNKNKGKVNKKQ